jgi:hypothetical protein
MSESKATASAFEDFVFKLLNPNWRPGAGQKHIREMGTYNHEMIERLALWHDTEVGHVHSQPRWEPVFVDQPGAKQMFLASRLTYDGRPFRCRPDVVMREANTGHVLILERKTHLVRQANPSRMRKGYNVREYDNIWAELWCYAWIDDWVESRGNMTLVSDLWNFDRWNTVVKDSRIARTFAAIDPGIRMYFSRYGGKIAET